MAGLTSEGFEKKTLAEIKTELEDAFRATFGFFINLLPGSVLATIIGIFAERESEIWDVAEAVYNSQYPDTADGNNLDNAVGYSGIVRLGATFSTIEGQLLFGEVGTLVPAGTQFSVKGNPLAKFETDDNVTLVAGQNEIQTIEFSSVPDAGTFTLTHRSQSTAALAHNASAADVQNALNALSTLGGVVVTGTFGDGFTVEFDGDDGLQPQPLITASSSLTASSNPVDITVSETQAGVAQGEVNLTATETGPVTAPIGTLTVIDTPVSGLDRTINMNSVVLGRARETDAELRIRRLNTLTVAGNATIEAIRSQLLNLAGVRNVFIFENDDLVTDGNGRPGKSYEVVIDGGVNASIAETIWKSKPAGIKTHGTETEVVVDSQGQNRTIRFSRPVEVPIYASIDLYVDPETFPANGAGVAQQRILDWGNNLGIGKMVVVMPDLIAQLYGIAGIEDIVVRIDDSAVSTTPGDPELSDNVPIDAFEVASFSAENVGVNIINA